MGGKNEFTPLEISKTVEKKAKSLRGFTLVEVLVASALLLLVVTAVFSTYVMLSQYVNNTTVQSILQRKARIAIKK